MRPMWVALAAALAVVGVAHGAAPHAAPGATPSPLPSPLPSVAPSQQWLRAMPSASSSPSTKFEGCPGFNVGSTFNAKDAVRDGLGRLFADDVEYAAYGTLANTFYVESTPQRNFTASIQALDNTGDCRPTIAPASGVARPPVSSFNVTAVYHCSALAGRARMLVTVHPGGDCQGRSVQFYWWKTVGTALRVATTAAGLQHPDVAQHGAASPHWALPRTVVPFDVPMISFYMNIEPGFGPEPIRDIFTLPSSSVLSLLPSAFTGPFSSRVLQYNLSFGCASSIAGGNVTVTPSVSPFQPTSWMFFKQCTPVPFLRVLEVTSTGHPLKYAATNGATSPGWRWTGPGAGSATTFPLQRVVSQLEHATYFGAVLQPDGVPNGYTMVAPSVSVQPLFITTGNASSAAAVLAGGAVPGFSVSGTLAHGGHLDATPRIFAVEYACGDMNGYAVFTATFYVADLQLGIAAPSPSTNVTFSWIKSCGYAVGFDVNVTSPSPTVLADPPVLPPVVAVNGAPSSAWQSLVPLDISTELLRFVYVQRRPFPSQHMAKELIPAVSDGALVPVPGGPLGSQHVPPVVTASPQELTVELWVKSAHDKPITLTITNLFLYSRKFEYSAVTETITRRHLFVSYPPFSRDGRVVAEGITGPEWSSTPTHVFTNPCRPPIEPFVTMSVTYEPEQGDNGWATLGPPRLRVNNTAACSPWMRFLGVHTNTTAFPPDFALNITVAGRMTFALFWNCTPASGYTAVTAVIPLRGDSAGTRYSPLKFVAVYNADVNVPGRPEVPSTPSDTLLPGAMAALSFTVPDDHCASILHYAIMVRATPQPGEPTPPFSYNLTLPAPGLLAVPGTFGSIQVELPNTNMSYNFRIAAANSRGLSDFTAWLGELSPAHPSATPTPSPTPDLSPSASLPPLRQSSAERTYTAVMKAGTWLAVAAAVLIIAVLLIVCTRNNFKSQGGDEPLDRVVSLHNPNSGRGSPLSDRRSTRSASSRRSKGSRSSKGSRRSKRSRKSSRRARGSRPQQQEQQAARQGLTEPLLPVVEPYGHGVGAAAAAWPPAATHGLVDASQQTSVLLASSQPLPLVAHPPLAQPASQLTLPPQPDSAGFVPDMAGLTPVQSAPIGDAPSESDDGGLYESDSDAR